MGGSIELHDSQPPLPPVVTVGRRRAVAAVVALLAVLGGALVSTAVVAQQDTTDTDNADVRIVARKLESGRIEFGLQQRQTDNSWGDRQLPRVRFFPTTAGINRWLASSPLDLPAGEVRIVARKLESGRIEFGLQQRQTDNSWGDRQLPRVRFFPTTAGINRWLASSPLTLTTSPPADRDTTPTGDDQTAPRPADRDTPATDDDQTAPRPADRDTTPTSDDQYGQFEAVAVEGANRHSWWQRPRGDLVVHVHLCVEQGSEHLAKREVIDAHVRRWNEIYAPFYAWQSSGLLNVSYTAGEITIANDVASHWDARYLPGSCKERLPPTRAHVGHAVILVGNPRSTTCRGWAELGGHAGVTFVTQAAYKTVADLQAQHAAVPNFEHLDHNIGQYYIEHFTTLIDGVTGTSPDASYGTRFRFDSLEAWEDDRGYLHYPNLLQEIVGTLAGYPAALQQREEGFALFPCHFLESQGWPVGPNAPACGRPRLLSVPPDILIDWLADGRPRITWRPPPPHPDDTEPVTGYTILLYGGDFIDARFDLPANPRSFVLPPSPIGEYQLGEVFEFRIVPRSANRLGSPESEWAAVGFPLTEIKIEEINAEFYALCIENCPPRSYKLSWPSNDLVESWGFLGGEGSYWNRATGAGQYTGLFDNETFVTEGSRFIRGKTYNLTVFACLKDPPPGGSGGTLDGCFPYATATFTPEAPETRVTSGAVTWTYTGTAERHRVYSAEWTHIPGITVYFIFVKGCTDTLRPCHFEDAWGASVEPDSSGTVTTHGVFLLYGTRYEVDIHACGSEDDANQPLLCPILLRSEITVPPSDS